MKKGIVFLFLFCFKLCLLSQTMGLSGCAMIMIPHYDNWSEDFNPGSNPAFHMTHENRFCTWIRVDGTYLRSADGQRIYPFFADYANLGITYIFPFEDSSSYTLITAQGYPFDVYKGEARNTMLNLGARFGYRIPQEFNDFLTIMLGYGGGALTARSVYPLPPPHGTYTYTKGDFDPASFHSKRRFTGNIEAFAGALYELEKFSLSFQYSFIYGFTEAFNNGGLLDAHSRQQVSVGIFYPLKHK